MEPNSEVSSDMIRAVGTGLPRGTLCTTKTFCLMKVFKHCNVAHVDHAVAVFGYTQTLIRQDPEQPIYPKLL